MNNQFYLEINGNKTPVSEEVYRAYKQPIWAEHKRKEREKRCTISDGKGGTKRCDGDCSKCNKQQTGSVLSLERFTEDGFEVPAPTGDLADVVAYKILLDELFKVLEEFDPDSRKLCELISAGFSEREIADIFGVRQSTLNYRKNKLFEELRKRLKDYR